MSAYTAASFERQLHLLMDAQALDDKREGHTASAVCDLNVIVSRASSALGLTARALASGQLARENVRQATGFHDRATREHRRIERAGHGARIFFSTRSIARTLRKPVKMLPVLTRGLTEQEIAEAIVIMALAPSAQLLAPDVERELGPKRFDQMARIKQHADAELERFAGMIGGARAHNSDAASHSEHRGLDGRPEV